jgi:hypothetical protein
VRDQIAVLIIGYQRVDNIRSILEIVNSNRINKIYVSVDAPKDGDSEGIQRNSQIRDLVDEFNFRFDGVVLCNFREVNRGCAASVLSSCNWVFKNEKYAIVFEDDCIPSDSFFDFVETNFHLLEGKSDIVMIGGSQLVPSEITKMKACLSSYPMIWGWASTSDKWRVLLDSFYNLDRNWAQPNRVNLVERVYWNSGHRRSLKGFIDVWDITIARYMRMQNLHSILPPVPYISNIGRDEFATHTSEESPFLNQDAQDFVVNQYPINTSKEIDNWIKKNVYKVRMLHLFTTRITLMLDLIRHKPYSNFLDRVEKANGDFH